MTDPSTWDASLDAVIAAPKHHKVLFENERLRVLDVTLGSQTTRNLSIITVGPRSLCSIRSRDRFMIFLQTVRSCPQPEMLLRLLKCGMVKDVWSCRWHRNQRTRFERFREEAPWYPS